MFWNKKPSPEDIARAEEKALEASDLFDEGLADSAEQAYRESAELWKQVHGKNSEDYAYALFRLGMVLHAVERFKEMEEVYIQAAKSYRNAVGKNSSLYAACKAEQARALGLQGRDAEAVPIFEEALRIDAETLEPGDTNYGNHLNSFAGVLQNIGEYDRALETFQQALEQYKQGDSIEHQSCANTLKGIVSILMFDMADYAQAE